eukprot:ANDGO_01163.mRNA.1 hypothetical protein
MLLHTDAHAQPAADQSVQCPVLGYTARSATFESHQQQYAQLGRPLQGSNPANNVSRVPAFEHSGGFNPIVSPVFLTGSCPVLSIPPYSYLPSSANLQMLQHHSFQVPGIGNVCSSLSLFHDPIRGGGWCDESTFTAQDRTTVNRPNTAARDFPSVCTSDQAAVPFLSPYACSVDVVRKIAMDSAAQEVGHQFCSTPEVEQVAAHRSVNGTEHPDDLQFAGLSPLFQPKVLQ